MIQTEPDSNFEDLKKKTSDLLLSLIGSIDDSNPQHVEALRHLYKGGTALKHTFESMKTASTVMNVKPTIKANNKNIDHQRSFFSTTKRRKKGNVQFAKPSDKDRQDFPSNDHFIVLGQGSGTKEMKKEQEAQGRRSKSDARF